LDDITKRAIFVFLLIAGGVSIGLSIFVYFYDLSGWFKIWLIHVIQIITGGLLIIVYIIAWRKKIFRFNS
jgi:hypothetical protein